MPGSSDWSSAEVWLEIGRKRAVLHRPPHDWDQGNDYDNPQDYCRLRLAEVHHNAKLVIRISLPRNLPRSSGDGLHLALTFERNISLTWTLDLDYVIGMGSRGYSIHQLFVLHDNGIRCNKGHLLFDLGSGMHYTCEKPGLPLTRAQRLRATQRSKAVQQQPRSYPDRNEED